MRNIIDFRSDNTASVCPEVAESLILHATKKGAAYGGDDCSQALSEMLGDFFETELWAYPVMTGTAANGLALGCITKPYGAVFCHPCSHIHQDENNAPQFLGQGVKLQLVDGEQGKISAQKLEWACGFYGHRGVHSSEPHAISISQLTECGTCYQLDELAQIGNIAKSFDLAVHMDGARLSNAVAYLGVSPADLTWRSGIDVVSFGLTKNGAWGAELVVFFNGEHAKSFEFYRKRSGHLISKMRLVSCQIEAMLQHGVWLRNATHANHMAQQLAHCFASVGIQPYFPVEGNEVFVRLSERQVSFLKDLQVLFYEWPMESITLQRFVCAFDTPDEIIRCFEALIQDMPL